MSQLSVTDKDIQYARNSLVDHILHKRHADEFDSIFAEADEILSKYTSDEIRDAVHLVEQNNLYRIIGSPAHRNGSRKEPFISFIDFLTGDAMKRCPECGNTEHIYGMPIKFNGEISTPCEFHCNKCNTTWHITIDN
ncbi:MAG: hypothetical protein WC262_09340 [Bacteroidales bacterium]